MMGLFARARYYCLDMAPRAQLLKNSAWLLHLIGDKAVSTARNSSVHQIDVVTLTSKAVDSFGV